MISDPVRQGRATYLPDLPQPLYHICRDVNRRVVENLDPSKPGAPDDQFVSMCFLVNHADWTILHAFVTFESCRVISQDCLLCPRRILVLALGISDKRALVLQYAQNLGGPLCQAGLDSIMVGMMIG